LIRVGTKITKMFYADRGQRSFDFHEGGTDRVNKIFGGGETDMLSRLGQGLNQKEVASLVRKVELAQLLLGTIQVNTPKSSGVLQRAGYEVICAICKVVRYVGLGIIVPRYGTNVRLKVVL
jgi:hypothetical protein